MRRAVSKAPPVLHKPRVIASQKSPPAHKRAAIYSRTYASSHWRPGITPEGNQAPHSEAQGRPHHRDPFWLKQGEAGLCHQEIGGGGDDRE
jgi:hypothetical protein